MEDCSRITSAEAPSLQRHTEPREISVEFRRPKTYYTTHHGPHQRANMEARQSFAVPGNKYPDGGEDMFLCVM